jgi:hypothetical protein
MRGGREGDGERKDGKKSEWAEGFCGVGEIPTSLMLNRAGDGDCSLSDADLKVDQLVGQRTVMIDAIICYGHLRRVIKGCIATMIEVRANHGISI